MTFPLIRWRFHARFISLHLAQCSKELMAESTWLLRRNGLITSEAVFVDGTKIEANANKHDFKTQRGRRPC